MSAGGQSKFIVGIPLDRLREIHAKAVEVCRRRDECAVKAAE